MTLMLRDARETDLDQLLGMNNAAGAAILPIDGARMRHLFRQAAYFRVAQIDDHLAGFLIGLDANADYDSTNFRFFADRYPAFTYIDRIVIAAAYRGVGLGRVFYADVQSYAEIRSPWLTCEVMLEPRNDAVVLFHGADGFHEIGQHSMPGGQHVSLLAKELCSYPYVARTYGTSLPDETWLRGRRDVMSALPLAASAS